MHKWEEKNAELQRMLDYEKERREEVQRARDQFEQEYIKLLNEKNALEEKLEHYENGEDSKSITYFMKENEKLRNIIRAQAEVI